MDIGPVETRVLGCLIEKQRTTPEAYPLTLNALRLACNQATNREPVLDLDDGEIRAALHRLGRRGWTRLASGAGSRAPKYRHLLDDALGLAGDELSVLAVLMLRGPQTPGELRTRTERMHRFDAPGELDATLARLAGRGHVERLERRPGQKEARYRQLLSDAQEGEEAPAPVPADLPAPVHGEAPAGLAGRVAALEAAVAELRSAVDALARGGPPATPDPGVE